MNGLRHTIFTEIDQERNYQEGKWGSGFDSKNTVNDWAAYINVYLSNATKMGVLQADQRTAILKVAALAVAALETYDCNDGFALRHYD